MFHVKHGKDKMFYKLVDFESKLKQKVKGYVFIDSDKFNIYISIKQHGVLFTMSIQNKEFISENILTLINKVLKAYKNYVLTFFIEEG